MPSLITPQLWSHPALTETKAPSGGVACPCESPPQQASVSSLITPQLWSQPALTEAKAPSGGVACPC